MAVTSQQEVRRTGFRRTEVGVIPADWKVKLLPEVCRFRSGKAHEQYISDSGRFVCVNSKFISTEGKVHKNCTANFCPAKQNDVLMVMSDLPNGRALAKAYFVEEDDVYAVNQRVCALTAYQDCPKYLFYVLNRNPYFLKRDDGVNQTHLLNHVFLTCPLPLPPTVAEQEAIAQALTDVDALLTSLDRLIAKKRNLKTATIQQLLTGKRRLPGFSREWEVKKLGELLDYEQPTEYLVKTADYDDDGSTPVLTAGKTFTLGHTNEETGVFTDLPVIIFDDFTTASRYVDFPFKVKSSAIKMLKPNDDSTNLRFVCEAMQLIAFALGDHKRYWISEYQQLNLRVPSREEQDAIASVLSDMDAEITALEARRDKTRAMKRGMMQQLLSGRIRLV